MTTSRVFSGTCSDEDHAVWQSSAAICHLSVGRERLRTDLHCQWITSF